MAVRNRTAQINQIHAFLLKYGIAAPKSRALLRCLTETLEDADNEMPFEGRGLLRDLGDELRRLRERVAMFDAQIAAADPACR